MLTREEQELLSQMFFFGPSRWRVNREHAEAPEAPFKIKIKHVVRDNPALEKLLAHLFVARIRDLYLVDKVDAIAELPHSISTVATLVHQELDIPMVSLDYKQNRIMGKPFSGMKLLELDDVITHGYSKKDSFRLANEHSLNIVYLVTRPSYSCIEIGPIVVQ